MTRFPCDVQYIIGHFSIHSMLYLLISDIYIIPPIIRFLLYKRCYNKPIKTSDSAFKHRYLTNLRINLSY